MRFTQASPSYGRIKDFVLKIDCFIKVYSLYKIVVTVLLEYIDLEHYYLFIYLLPT